MLSLLVVAVFVAAVVANISVVLVFFGVFLNRGRKNFNYTGTAFLNDTERAAVELAAMLRSATKCLRLVGGDASDGVYSHREFLDALGETLRRPDPPEIEMVFGPLADEARFARGGLAQMTHYPKLTLYFLTVPPVLHFRLVDPGTGNATVYVEEPHEPGAEHRKVHIVRNPSESGVALQERFALAKSTAIRWTGMPSEPPAEERR